MHDLLRTSLLHPLCPFTQSSFPSRSLVHDGPTRPHMPRLIVPHNTRPSPIDRGPSPIHEPNPQFVNPGPLGMFLSNIWVNLGTTYGGGTMAGCRRADAGYNLTLEEWK